MTIKFVLAIFLIQAVLYAETKPGTVEIAPYAGVSWNIQGATAILTTPQGVIVEGGKKTHGAFGGSIAVSPHRYFWLYGDLGYFPLGSAEAGSGQNRISSTASALALTGGGQIQYPGKRFAPYVSIGYGIFHSALKTSALLAGSSIERDISGNNGALHGAFGLRLYVTERWGVRPAVEGYDIYADGRRALTAWRFTFGVFFQTKRND